MSAVIQAAQTDLRNELLLDKEVRPIAATGLPVGMFCQERYAVKDFKMNQGDRLFLYTDGLSEAHNRDHTEYSADRLQSFLRDSSRSPAAATLVSRVLDDLRGFASGSPMSDDLTVMAIEMVGH
jgi:sigma-B regulation protein RsbU (phosphoserine phosphatase)